MEHAQALLKSLYVMAMMVEARDAYTGGHLWRVSQFARLVAERMQLPADEVARVELGGFLHDLGKVGIPDAVLNKRDRLSDEEYAVIKTHPQVGADLLAGHPLAALAMDAVWLHHETPDGRGYPFHRRGTELTVEMRMIAVADVFQALAQKRPYRQPLSPARILDMLRAFVAQNRLDGAVVDLAGQDVEASWRAATGAESFAAWSRKAVLPCQVETRDDCRCR